MKEGDHVLTIFNGECGVELLQWLLLLQPNKGWYMFSWRYDELESFCKFMDSLIDLSPPDALQGASSFNSRIKHKLQIILAPLFASVYLHGSARDGDAIDIIEHQVEQQRRKKKMWNKKRLLQSSTNKVKKEENTNVSDSYA
ncbi:FAD dependent oxidoreductase [Artemisia annua]|uniref:FAD dependent oxidoreductase n=1 Tax=Artemisia annua TaxID=35608 RepID=A0A2U1MHB6_ARTAN|nr:FAD dependent oxidoreductase [Artemisia annua]